MVDRKKNTQTVSVAEPIVIEEAMTVKKLRDSLDEIKGYAGVVGYILRNSTSAVIDLKDPTRIMNYAILSSSSIEACEELGELFDLGSVKNVVIEGKNIKVLSLLVNEYRLSIFTEKDVDIEKILERLNAS